MTEETAKASTGSRNKASNIHSILSSSDPTSNTLPSPQRSRSQLLEFGQESQPLPAAAIAIATATTTASVASSTSPSRPRRRDPEQDRKKQRHIYSSSVPLETASEPEKEFQDNQKRRKLSVVPHPFTLGSAEDTRQDNFGLSVDDDAPLRSFPVREYPRRLSIASVLTADSSSLPSVVSPATSVSWAGLASATSSTTTNNPPQWSFFNDIYNPVSHKSPITSTRSITATLGPHSRALQRLGAEDPELQPWELDLEAAPSRQPTPHLRSTPRRSQPDLLSFHGLTHHQKIAMSQGGHSREGVPGISQPGGSARLSSAEEGFRATISGSPADPELQPSVEAYNELVADLQHKLSTKTLALETLQKEHDRLLGAYSRQQTRTAAIQKKCTVADAEIVGLSAERDRLQDALDMSENQVQELIEQRDAVNRRLVSRVREYSSIVQLASEMENLSTLELKRWRERDAALRSQIAERDRAIEEIQQRLAVAESAEETQRSTPIPGSEGEADEVTTLKMENENLKQKLRRLEESLAERMQEVSRMEEIGRMLFSRSREESDGSPSRQPGNAS